MKLHTALSRDDVWRAMSTVKDAGRVTRDVGFVRFEDQRSRSHEHGYLIKLGTWDKTTGPTLSRYWRGTGNYGAATDQDMPYAATYDEWGFFIAELFRLDPGARFGHYLSAEDFHRKTDGKYAE